MRSILDQLDGEEAVLLMYLAGELPSADHMAVEQRLASDDQLRSQLEALRASQEQISGLLDGLDASQPFPGSAVSSQRALSRIIKQWHAEKLLRASQAKTQAPNRSKWIWIGPAAAAAMLLIAWGVWWGIQPDKYAPIGDALNDTTANAFGADVSGDDNTADALAGNSGDLDFSLDDSREYASMVSDVYYLQTLSELTTLTQ